MGELGEYWRDVKGHFREKQKKYEQEIESDYSWLVDRSIKKGNQHRIGDWDFWGTGTVRNYKTGKHITIKQLRKLVEDKLNKNI